MASAQQTSNTSVVCRLQRSHIPQVCDLFANTFRPGTAVQHKEIEQCLEDTYLTSPLDKMEPSSIVAIKSDGRVDGFMGMISLGAFVGHEKLRWGVLGNFMADSNDRPRIALRLLRAVVDLDLGFIFTDTANATSLDLSRVFKFSLLPLASLEWIKILRPFGAVRLGLRRSAGTFQRAAAFLVPPLDPLTRRLPFVRMPNTKGAGIVDRQIGTAEFVARAPDYLKMVRYAFERFSTDLKR